LEETQAVIAINAEFDATSEDNICSGKLKTALNHVRAGKNR
jgi:hypothetical protein